MIANGLPYRKTPDQIEDDLVPLGRVDDWPDRCPDCGAELEPLLAPWMKGGQPSGAMPVPGDLRARTLEALDTFEIIWEDEIQ